MCCTAALGLEAEAIKRSLAGDHGLMAKIICRNQLWSFTLYFLSPADKYLSQNLKASQMPTAVIVICLWFEPVSDLDAISVSV